MNPHGFDVRPGPFGQLGQIVVDPVVACRLAMEKGNVIAVRILTLGAAGIFAVAAQEASNPLATGVFKNQAEQLIALAERPGPETAAPETVFNEGERNLICNFISLAHGLPTESSTALAAHNRLIDVAKQVQDVLQDPDPGVFDPQPIAPGIGGTSALTVALAIFGVVAAAGTAFYFIRR